MENQEQKQVQQPPAPSFEGINFATQVLGFKPVATPPPEPKPDEKPPEQKSEVIETPLMNIPLVTDDVYKKISAETGFNFEKEEDLINTLKKFKEFEQKEEQYLKDNLEGNNYKQFFNILPEDLRRLVVDYGSNQDYKQTIKQLYGVGGVDYSKSWGDYEDKFSMISKYNPELSQEDWEEMDSKTQKTVENLAKKNYETERTAFNESAKQREELFVQQRREFAQKFEKSIEDSIARLKKDVPDMNEKRVNDVRTKMYQNPFVEMVNTDGTYKEDAATKIAFAYHGQETMSQVIQKMTQMANEQVMKAAKDASQGPLEDHIKRLNDKPPESNDRQDEDKRQEAIRETTRSLFYQPSTGFRNKQT